MSVDERLRAELARVAGQVRPAPDPLGRLLARRRYGRWRRLGGGLGVVAAVGALTAALIPVLAQPGDGSPATSWDWMQRVVDAPPRGDVGTQPGFAAALTGALDAQDRAGGSKALESGHVPVAQKAARLLLAADVGDQRVAAVALLAPGGSQIDRLAETTVVLLLGPRGASPATLVAAAGADPPAATGYFGGSLSPFTVGEVGARDAPVPGPMLAVGLAPPGCEVSSAALPAVSDWRAEPSGSFLLRPGAQRRAEWWRVTCDGVLRDQEPAPIIADPANPDTVQFTDAGVAAAVVGARGTPDADVVTTRMALSSLTGIAGYGLATRPRVVWGGPVTALPPTAAEVTVVAAPVVGGGWVGSISVAGGQTQENRGGLFHTDADPFDPAGVVAAWLEPEPVTTLFVVAPVGAVSVRVTRAGQVLGSATVVSGAAVLSVAQQDGLTVSAVDGTGRPLATAVATGPGLLGHSYADWDD